MKNNKNLFFTLILLFLFINVFSCKITPQEDKRYQDVIFKEKPNAVNITAPNVVLNIDEAVISWDYIENASGYNFYYQTAADYTDGPNVKNVQQDWFESDETRCNLSKYNLKEGEVYVFVVEPYKFLPNGDKILGDKSEPKEMATKPKYEFDVIIDNSKATLLFNTIGNKSVLNPGKKIFTPEYVVYAEDEDIAKDIFEKIVSDSSVAPGTDVNPNIVSNENIAPVVFDTKTNKKLYEVLRTTLESITIQRDIPSAKSFTLTSTIDKLHIENSDPIIFKNEHKVDEDTIELDVVNDPIKNPPTVTDFVSKNNAKDYIELSWKTPKFNDGVDGDIVQRFEITRTENGNSTVVLTSDDDSYIDADTEATADRIGEYKWRDTTVSEGKSYDYSIKSVYFIIEKGKTSKYYSFQSEELTEAHILSAPISATSVIDGGVVVSNTDDVTDSDTTDDESSSEKYIKYTITLNWENMFADNDIKNKVVRYTILPNGDREEEELTLTDDDLTNCSLTDTIIITQEENKNQYTFFYAISCINTEGDESSSVHSNNVLTIPSVHQITFIRDGECSEVSQNAKNATIKFKVPTQDFLNENYNSLDNADQDNPLDVNKIVYKILRGTDKANLTVIKDNLNASDFVKENLDSDEDILSYNDENLADNTTYYYQVVAKYSDVNSLYDGQMTLISIDNVKTLKAVETLTATEAESDEFITVTWNTVDEASGYCVEYSEDNSTFIEVEDQYIASSSDIQNGVLYFTKGKGTLDAGKTYFFRVSAKDSVSKCTSSSVVAEGSLFGPYGFNFTASVLKYGEQIELTWNEVKGADRYEIYVYTDNTKDEDKLAVDSAIKVRGNTLSYMFKSSNIKDSLKENSFALSQSYFFVVLPVKENANEIDSSFLQIKEGKWLPAPKNIRASKALYSQFVTVSFDKVDDADGYVVYRRLEGTEDWTTIKTLNNNSLIMFDDINVIDSQDYEYTVSSTKKTPKIESAKQSYFEQDGESEYNENTNIGYKLSAPQILEVQELYIDAEDYMETSSNYPIIVKVQGVKGATSYTLTSTSGVQTYTIDQIKAKGNAQVGKIGYIETDSDGVMSFYIPRPIVVSSPLFKVEVFATNDNQDEIESQKNSEVDSDEIVPSKLKYVEIVNLVNNPLKDILQEIDNELQGDWWRGWASTGYSGREYNGTTSSGIKIYCNANASTTRDGRNDYFELINYKYVSGLTTLTLNTTQKVIWYPRDNGSSGYLGDDGLDYIGKNNNGIINVVLPLRYGNATIQYKSVKVDGSGGTYSVTYNGKTVDIQSSQVYPTVKVLFNNYR